MFTGYFRVKSGLVSRDISSICHWNPNIWMMNSLKNGWKLPSGKNFKINIHITECNVTKVGNCVSYRVNNSLESLLEMEHYR